MGEDIMAATEKPRARSSQGKVVIEFPAKEMCTDVIRVCPLTVEEAEVVMEDMTVALARAKAYLDDAKETRRAELRAELAELDA